MVIPASPGLTPAYTAKLAVAKRHHELSSCVRIESQTSNVQVQYQSASVSSTIVYSSAR